MEIFEHNMRTYYVILNQESLYEKLKDEVNNKKVIEYYVK